MHGTRQRADADSNDDLAVAEGNISLSNLSGYPIGTGDLGFDTATQSELDVTPGTLATRTTLRTTRPALPRPCQIMRAIRRPITASRPRPV
ncbi:hypothetical protein C8039_03090 [Halogeometricum sp. wsp3]|nr:hypothetical protein C8039_03090 [Halogeometricum sp. wsp3]